MSAEPTPEPQLIRVERWRERTQSVVIDNLPAVDHLDAILAEAVDMLEGAHNRHPTVLLGRPDDRHWASSPTVSGACSSGSTLWTSLPIASEVDQALPWCTTTSAPTAKRQAKRPCPSITPSSAHVALSNAAHRTATACCSFRTDPKPRQGRPLRHFPATGLTARCRTVAEVAHVTRYSPAPGPPKQYSRPRRVQLHSLGLATTD